MRVEKEITDELEGSLYIDADPEDDVLLKTDIVPDFNYSRKPADSFGQSEQTDKEE